MAIEQRSVEVGICDACRKYCPGGPNGEPPEGVSGTVDTGKDVAVWFSCSTAAGHIGKAIRITLGKATLAVPDKGGAT